MKRASMLILWFLGFLLVYVLASGPAILIDRTSAGRAIDVIYTPLTYLASYTPAYIVSERKLLVFKMEPFPNQDLGFSGGLLPSVLLPLIQPITQQGIFDSISPYWVAHLLRNPPFQAQNTLAGSAQRRCSSSRWPILCRL
jgi:hypothetical protein